MNFIMWCVARTLPRRFPALSEVFSGFRAVTPGYCGPGRGNTKFRHERCCWYGREGIREVPMFIPLLQRERSIDDFDDVWPPVVIIAAG